MESNNRNSEKTKIVIEALKIVHNLSEQVKSKSGEILDNNNYLQK